MVPLLWVTWVRQETSLQQRTAAEWQQSADRSNAGLTRAAGALPTCFTQQAEPGQETEVSELNCSKVSCCSYLTSLLGCPASTHSLNFPLAFSRRFNYFAARHMWLCHFAQRPCCVRADALGSLWSHMCMTSQYSRSYTESSLLRLCSNT